MFDFVVVIFFYRFIRRTRHSIHHLDTNEKREKVWDWNIQLPPSRVYCLDNSPMEPQLSVVCVVSLVSVLYSVFPVALASAV